MVPVVTGICARLKGVQDHRLHVNVQGSHGEAGGGGHGRGLDHEQAFLHRMVPEPAWGETHTRVLNNKGDVQSVLWFIALY